MASGGRYAATSRRTISASTSGMSPSSTTAAATSSGSAAIPARTEVFIPLAYSGFSTAVQARSESSARILSFSWPVTTSTGSRPAPSAVSTARRTSDRPPTSRSILLRPIRVESPAASTTPATRSAVMDASAPLAQMASRAAGVHRQELGDDADRDLLGPIGAHVDADRGKEPVGVDPEIAQHLLAADARPEQAEV